MKTELRDCPECGKLTLMARDDVPTTEWYPGYRRWYCMLCGKWYREVKRKEMVPE